MTLCEVEDDRLTELSGLVVRDDGPWAVDDGGREVAVHRLDPATCAITETRTADIDPFDVEDLALGPDGAFWVADIGDNERRRDTVAVIVLPERGQPRLHRLNYPDGPHDAEALIVDPLGRPVVITKEIGAPPGVYRPDAAPEGVGPTPMRRVGTVTLPPSDTVGGPIGGFGTRTVTGAAFRGAPAGAAENGPAVVAVRTYTDAWLYPVALPGPTTEPDPTRSAADPTADPAAAVTGDVTPIRVPLPDEPQGEAVAFTPDDALLSASEARGGVRGALRRVDDVSTRVRDAAAAARPGAEAAPGATDSGDGRPAGDGAGEDVATDGAATDGDTAGGSAADGTAAGGDAAAPPLPWQTAAVGGAVAVAVLGLLTAAMALRVRRRR